MPMGVSVSIYLVLFGHLAELIVNNKQSNQNITYIMIDSHALFYGPCVTLRIWETHLAPITWRRWAHFPLH